MAEFDKRFLAALALLITASSHAAEPIPAASVVRFNTVCANCHLARATISSASIFRSPAMAR